MSSQAEESDAEKKESEPSLFTPKGLQNALKLEAKVDRRREKQMKNLIETLEKVGCAATVEFVEQVFRKTTVVDRFKVSVLESTHCGNEKIDGTEIASQSAIFSEEIVAFSVEKANDKKSFYILMVVPLGELIFDNPLSLVISLITPWILAVLFTAHAAFTWSLVKYCWRDLYPQVANGSTEFLVSTVGLP